jgi:hypothetical protein
MVSRGGSREAHHPSYVQEIFEIDRDIFKIERNLSREIDREF